MITISGGALVLFILLVALCIAAAAVSIRLALKVLVHLGSVNLRLEEMVDASMRFADAQSKLNASQLEMNGAINAHLAAQRTINEGLSFFLVRRGPKQDKGEGKG